MYCILVAGMMASGKTTIAEKLAKELKIPLLSKDSIKEILFDDLGFHSRAEKNQLGIAAMNMMYYAAAQMMKQNLPFILENNFEDLSVPQLMKILNRYHYDGITLRLTGNPEVLYRRFAARDLSPERHRGHVVNDQYPEPEGGIRENPTRKSYEQYVTEIEERGFCRFAANGPVISIDVTDFDKVRYEAILSGIRSAIDAVMRDNEGYSWDYGR